MVDEWPAEAEEHEEDQDAQPGNGQPVPRELPQRQPPAGLDRADLTAFGRVRHVERRDW